MEMTLFGAFAIQRLGGLRKSGGQSKSITTSKTFLDLACGRGGAWRVDLNHLPALLKETKLWIDWLLLATIFLVNILKIIRKSVSWKKLSLNQPRPRCSPHPSEQVVYFGVTQENIIEWVSSVNTWRGGGVVGTTGELWITAENTPQGHSTKGGQGSSGIFSSHSNVSSWGLHLHFWMKPSNGKLWVLAVGCFGIHCDGQSLGLEAEHRQHLPSSIQITFRALVLVMLESLWGRYAVSQWLLPMEVFQGFLCLAYELCIRALYRTALATPQPTLFPVHAPEFSGLSGNSEVFHVFFALLLTENMVHHSYLVSLHLIWKGMWKSTKYKNSAYPQGPCSPVGQFQCVPLFFFSGGIRGKN